MKVRDFLPVECVEAFEHEICEYPDKYLNPDGKVTANEAIRVFRDWLNTETTAELDGVKAIIHEGPTTQYDCPICDEYLDHKLCDGGKINYCPNCGTKIKWEARKMKEKLKPCPFCGGDTEQ